MAKYDYDLYDTVPFNNVAAVTFALFKVGEGADSTHTRQYTNMRGNGSLPTNEKFTVRSIHLIAESSPVLADIEKLYENCWLEFIYNNLSILRSPLRLFASASDWYGHYTQAAAADATILGAGGMGRNLSIPIELKGGTSFEVDVYQNVALSAAFSFKLVLRGDLELGAG